MALQTFKAEFFKALAHPIRIRILEVLRGRERSVQELQAALDLEQPIVSAQLALLRRSNVVGTRKVGHHGPLHAARPAGRRPARRGPEDLRPPPGRHAGHAARAPPGGAPARPALTVLRQLRTLLRSGIVTEPIPRDAEVERLGERLAVEIRRVFRRSLAIRQVDAGSCNACELEIAGLTGPHYDLERFGLHFVASPRHADCLLVTGPVTRNMAEPLRLTWEATPDPEAGHRRRRLRPRRRHLPGLLRRRGRRRRRRARGRRHPRVPAHAGGASSPASST